MGDIHLYLKVKPARMKRSGIREGGAATSRHSASPFDFAQGSKFVADRLVNYLF